MKIRVYIETYPWSKECDPTTYYLHTSPLRGSKVIAQGQKSYIADIEVPDPPKPDYEVKAEEVK